MTFNEIVEAFKQYMKTSLCVDGNAIIEANKAVTELTNLLNSLTRCTRRPFEPPDNKEPLMSDREALGILCKYSTINGKLAEAIEVAIRALEDKILLEDDGR